MVTKISSTVIGSNALIESAIGSNVIVARHIASNAIETRHLGTGADATAVSENVEALQINLTANINTVHSNVAAITDATTDLNIGSGLYVFDKSRISLGLANSNPATTTLSLGTPANVVIQYGGSDPVTGGNVIIGLNEDNLADSPYRLDVRGTANTGIFRATSIGIGTAPSRPLTIETGENEIIRLINTHNGGNAKIEYRNNYGVDTNWYTGLDESDGSFRFNFKEIDAETGTNSGEDTYVAIKKTMQMGVGTASPSANLHVVGTGKFTEQVNIDDDLVVTGNVGLAGNTAPAVNTLSLGTPANAILRTHTASGAANLIIGDATVTSPYNLDVRGTANVGALTAVSLSGLTSYVVSDGGTIGSASATDAMTIASTGIVTFVDDIKIKNDGTIGSASAPTAMTIDSAGIVAFVDDIKVKDDGTIGTATTPTAITIASDGDTAISGGLGVAGNTGPVAGELSLGTPANIILKTHSAGVGNVIIGFRSDLGGTPYNLDVRGTANVGALTAVSLSGPTALTVSDGGTVGSASATNAMTIASSGIVTFKDDIVIKDGGTIGATSAPTAMTVAATGIVTFVDDIKIKNDGTIGSAGAATAMTIDSSGIVTFVDDIKIKDGGTIGTATTPTAITIASDGDTAIAGGLGVAGNTAPTATGITLGTPANVVIRALDGKTGNVIIGDATVTSPHSLDVRGTANVGALTATSLVVPNDGDIGSTGATDAMQISSGGIVTFKDDIKIKDGGTIGVASAAGAITIASTGIVTFVDDIKVKDDGTIGSASAPTAMTIDSAGIVAFVDDIKVKDDGTIGSATAPTAMTIDSAGIVAFVDDIKIKDGGTIGVASKTQAMTLASDGAVTLIDDLTVTGNITSTLQTVVTTGLGVAGNTAPTATGLSIGTPANVVIRALDGKTGNVIIGDATVTSSHSLDVRGSANTGSLTATTIVLSADGGVQVPNDGNIGSAGATDAMQISSGGIVTFKDDIKVKDDGTIGSATAPTAMTIDSSGIVAFVDDIKVKDDGTIGSASAPTAMTIDSSGIVAFVDDIKIKDSGTIGSATTPGAITVAGDGAITVADDLTITGNLTVSGDTVDQNVTNLTVEDRIILTASGASGSPSLDTGLMMSRGSQGNVFVGYDESVNKVVLAHTRSPHTNTAISATIAANLDAAAITATSITIGSASINETELEILDGATLSTTELNYVDGVTSAIQTQIDAKAAKDGSDSFTGAVTITDATATSSDTTGALKVTGGISTQADLGIGNDIYMDSDSAIINMGDNDDVKITHVADIGIAVNLGLGIAGNTAPTATGLSLGTPANATLRTHASGAANLIIGDATVTSPYNLDVRGTANTGALTATTIALSADGGVQVPNDGNIGSAGTTDAIQISSGGIVTFKDDIKIKDGGTIGSASAAGAITIASTGIVTFVDDIKVKDDGTIGSATAPTAMTIDSSGIVAFVDDIKIKDDGTIGSASAPTAMTIDSAGIVAFVDDIKVKDDGTIGSASAPTAMTIDSAGIVAFVDDIKIKDGGTIGTATTPTAVTVASDGKVTLADDLRVAGNASFIGNTIAAHNQVSFGNPSNVVIIANQAGKGGNIIIGAGETGAENGYTPYRLDVHGTANVGVLTATTIALSADGGVQVPNDGNIGSAGATDAMQISSGGIVTFKDDIKVKDDGTIGSATAPTAMTIDSSGIVAFVDDIKIKDGGTIGTATTPTAIALGAAGGIGILGNTNPVAGALNIGAAVYLRPHTASGSGNVIIGDPSTTSPYNLDVRGTANVGVLTTESHTSIGAIQGTTLTATADGGVQVPNDGNIGSAGATDAMQISSGGIVTFKDDIKVKDGGTIGTATTPGAITIASDGDSAFSGGLGLAGNTAPTATGLSLGTPANVVVRAVQGGNVIIGDATATSNHRLDVRGTANVGNLTATRLVIPNDGYIGTPGIQNSIQISSGGIVTFIDDIKIKDGGTIGVASAADAMTVSSAGIVTFKDDIKIKDAGTIGTATTPTAITIAADGKATLLDDLDITGNNIVNLSLGLAGNTAPAIFAGGVVNPNLSLGNPANVVIRTFKASGAGNVIIGDATATTPYNLDVRGTANVGAFLTQGVDPLANDLATYTRLNANLNVVQDNVDAVAGTTLAPTHNVVTTVASANAYGAGGAVTAIARTRVILSGISQLPTTDYVVPSSGVIQLTEPAANIPAGLELLIRRWA